MTLQSVSYRVFGGYAKKAAMYFPDVQEELQKANMTYTLEEWLALSGFFTASTFIVEMMIFSFIFGLLSIQPLMAVFLSLTLSGSIAGGMLFLFYSYPGAQAKAREVNIRKVLPFAVSYLSSIATKDAPPIFFFRTLSQFDEYGEVAKDCRTIVRDVEVFGMSLHSAIKRRANSTPSKEFKELLWGINNVYASGGNINDYVSGKSNDLMADYRRRIKKYAQDLSLFVEIYLTLIIVGAMFFVVLSSIMAAITSGAETAAIQSFIVFIILPLLSVGFMMLMKSISPNG